LSFLFLLIITYTTSPTAKGFPEEEEKKVGKGGEETREAIEKEGEGRSPTVSEIPDEIYQTRFPIISLEIARVRRWMRQKKKIRA
jgi:phosphoribosyl-ATP pyrophosphohydrolase